jgi:hypothetical protein
MSVIPIRGVGEIGIIADLLPYDVPFNAWNSGRNIRFKNKTISRASVFRKLNTPFTFTGDPAVITDAAKSGAQGVLVSVQSDGVFRQLFNGVHSVVSPTVPWSATLERIVTARLGGVTYFSNPDNRPVYRADPAVGAFAYLPGWATNDRCASLRPYKDFLVALNVTKGSVNFENMIKWSDATQANSPPANWDTTSPSSLAGETVLNDARGKLVDGVTLGNSMILYGTKETYRMIFIGAPFVFAFEKAFDDLGVLSVDCVVEVDGKHYVFGNDAIYVHDGMAKVAISDNRVTERIYSRLDASKANRCFAFVNKMKSEVVFCYPSVGDDCAWRLSEITGCNEAVVYNYADNTWSFLDMPSVVSSAIAVTPIVTTWNDLATWDTLSSSWRAFDGSAPELTVVVSTGNATRGVGRTIYFYDDLFGGLLSNPVETALLWPAYVESSVKDSDELSATLSSRKLVRSITPQVMSKSADGHILVSLGSAKNPNTDVLWTGPRQFMLRDDYKCDFRVNGRYLLLKFEIPSSVDAEISGYDIDLDVISER